MPTRFEISLKTVIYLGLSIIGLWLVYQVRDLLSLLFISFILMTALRPIVDNLESWGLPKILSILLIYIIIIAILIGSSSIIFPPLINQTVRLINNLPNFFQEALPFIRVNSDIVLRQIAPLTQDLARLTVGVFSNLFTLITILVFTFYFLLEHGHLSYYLDTFVGRELGLKITTTIQKIEARLGSWIRGQILLGLIIGMTSYLGLSLLGVSSALPLALIAGILEVVPIIGPIISATFAVIVALMTSPGLALAVLALYIVIQQLENNLVVPQVMRRTVGLPPLASLLALMIGGRLAGMIGIVLAIPTLLVIQILITEFVIPPKLK